MKLENKIAVIAGGGGGMGKEISLLFSKEGAKIIILDIDDKNTRNITELINSEGGEAFGFKLDITNEEQVEKIVDLINKKYKRIDVLVNCVGASPGCLIENMSLREWQKIIDINLTGPFLISREVGKIMIKQGGGKIINFGSTVSIFGAPRLANYTAAKHGIIGLTRALAIEWGKYNINVNCVCPGSTKTPLFVSCCDKKEVKKREKRIPLKRIGLPEEQAKVTLFLATEDSSYINGEYICVDGGISVVSPITSTENL